MDFIRGRFVKLFAIIQIAVLLSTSLIPEGRLSVSAGGCGCSSAERTAGTCCCSAGTGTASCCAVAKPSSGNGKSSCCQKVKDKEAGETAGPKCCRSNKATAPGVQSSCPCGAATQLAIIMMPRLQAPATSNPRLSANGVQADTEHPETGRTKEAPAPRPPRIG